MTDDDIELPPGPADTDDEGVPDVKNDVVDERPAPDEPAAGTEP